MLDLIRFLLSTASFITSFFSKQRAKLKEMDEYNRKLEERIRILEVHKKVMLDKFVKKLMDDMKKVDKSNSNKNEFFKEDDLEDETL